jgi:hypothetical protein
MKRAVLALISTALSAYGANVPTWVREAAAQSVPSYPPKVSNVILLQEEQLTVSPDGRRTIRERGVLKILQRDRESITAYRNYNSKTGKVRDFHGWLITPAGRETVLGGKNDLLDVAVSESYDESRSKVLECPKDAPPGSVFAWEMFEEERTVFTQYSYSFQQYEPVLISRFSMTTPPGWEVRGTTINGPKLQPQTSGQSSTWELRNLPWIADEDYRPDTHALAPRLGITFFPSSSAAAELKPLGSWGAVAAWLSGFTEASAEVTPAIRAKSAELTKNATDPLDKMRAIAEFAQATSYVSVQINLSRGGGYTPHRAEQVLSRNYGDCKDKATLMRALLKAQGIESYMAVLYSGDRDYVRPEWPSPFQFNHAIIAIQAPEGGNLPAIAEHPKLGRLLIFDPTDPTTPFGDLPDEEQGSQALIVAATAGDLLRLPLLPPDRNHVQSDVTGEITPTGGLKAKLVRTYSGAAASDMRELLADEKATRKLYEVSLSRRLGGVTLNSIVLTPGATPSVLQASADFNVNQFGKVMQNRLLVVSPGNIVAVSDYLLTGKTRTLPLKIRARSRRNTIRLKVPEGFEPDEIPDPVSVTSEYGDFQATWAVKGGEILFDQSVTYKDTTVPAADYAKVQAFFEGFAGAQGNAVVLIRKK